MASTFDENIDPVLRVPDPPIISPRPTTSPALLPDGSLVSKPDFEAHLYVHSCLASVRIRSPASLTHRNRNLIATRPHPQRHIQTQRQIKGSLRGARYSIRKKHHSK